MSPFTPVSNDISFYSTLGFTFSKFSHLSLDLPCSVFSRGAFSSIDPNDMISLRNTYLDHSSLSLVPYFTHSCTCVLRCLINWYNRVLFFETQSPLIPLPFTYYIYWVGVMVFFAKNNIFKKKCYINSDMLYKSYIDYFIHTNQSLIIIIIIVRICVALSSCVIINLIQFDPKSKQHHFSFLDK